MSTKEKFKTSSKELGKKWKEALDNKDSFGGGFEPEDGRYVVAITLAKIGESATSGRTQVTWEYLFLDGDYICLKI